VDVGVEGDADVGMAEALLHDLVVAERHDPVAVLGLQLLENRPVPLDRELLYDLELVLPEVDVHPSKGQNLTSAQTGDEPEMERRKEPMLGRRPDELPRFVERPAELLPGPVGPGCLGQRHRVRRHPAPLDRLLERHRQDLPNEAGRRRAESGTGVRLGSELADPGVDHLARQVPEPHGAEQRDDVAADRPGVLVVGGDLDPAFLGRQPYLVQELGESFAGRSGPPVRQRSDVTDLTSPGPRRSWESEDRDGGGFHTPE